MRSLAVISLFVSGLVARAVEVRVATFNIGAHWNETYFNYSLGDPGTADYDSVRDVLARIDADVVALQEIHAVDLQGNPNDVQSLAAELGYGHLYVTPHTNAIDSSLKVVILSRFPFLQTTAINSPAGARELTRLHPMVTVDVPGTTNDLTLISCHLKAGTLRSDRFQRAVAAERIVRSLGGPGTSGDDNFVILGDFNPSSINTTFTELPNSGLPSTYSLGADISFPVFYHTNPAEYFPAPKPVRIPARQVDQSPGTFNTTSPGGPALDLVLLSPALAARPFAAEIYNSALDAGSPGLRKAGAPPAPDTSAIASDHYAVFADLELDGGLPGLAIAISHPSAPEGTPAGTVTVSATLPAPRAADLSVTFASDDPAAVVPAPAVVVIPAGSTQVASTLEIPRNFQVDGTRSVLLTISTPVHDSASASIEVTDVDGAYELAAIGQPAGESFDGFTGAHDPAPWSLDAVEWIGPDDGSLPDAGARSYGGPADGSLGFLPGGSGAVATAPIVNSTGGTIRSLAISFDVEHWRAGTSGAADAVMAELLVDGNAMPLPELTHVAATSQSLSTVARGLSIAPGATFDLRVKFVPGGNSAPLPADVFLNEIHYDNTGPDTGEFLEVAVAPGFTAALSTIDVLLYNGANGQLYGTHNLATFTAGEITEDGFRLFWKYVAGIQNGDPDGVAIVDNTNGTTLQFLSYGGTFTATNGPASGQTSVSMGVKQSGSEPVGEASLRLVGSGQAPGDFTWARNLTVAHSPGQTNVGQTFALSLPGPHGFAIDNLSITALADPDHDSDGDGQPDAYEFAFGSDPHDAGSVFRPAIAPSDDGRALTFPGAAGISYTIEWSDTLGDDWQELETRTGTGVPVVIPLPTDVPRRFFRVKAPY